MKKILEIKHLHLYCFRHGETDWNKIGRFQGRIDILLNENGRAQAAEVAPKLMDIKIQAIYSSPLKRALETAQIVAKYLEVPVFQREDLSEIDPGLASGLLQSEIKDKFGVNSLERWASDDESDDEFGFPEGEKKNIFRQRAVAAIRSILNIAENISKNSSNKNVAIVTHGFFLKQLIIALGSKDHYGMKNGEIVHITYDTTQDRLQFIERINHLSNG
ncbi:MAG: histidine phosphatase family protein [Oligoflexia bacterium]|nr:histidine phosphatase family protein [Oligoflexia bacterium]